MTDHPFQGWLEKAANYPGVLACGVCLSNQAIVVKSFAESFPEARIKELLQSLSEVAFNLRYYQLAGSRLRWVFEHGQLHVARRADSAFAVLAVNNDPGAAAGIEELFAEFIKA
ncbi:MAG: hypothetical protein ABSG59_24080 [Verrucomicrobiota bacterium]|jgi:hypothetical protein